MPIEHLPGRDPNAGWPPDAPGVGLTLVEEWWKRYRAEAEQDLPMAVEGARFRASQAGSCLRSLQYDYLELPETEQPTVADAWRFELGHLIHAEMQQIVLDLYGTHATAEAKMRFDVGEDLFGATHVDLLVEMATDNDAVDVVEIKSVSGYPFKMMASSFRGPPQGPRFSHQRQLALEARAVQESGRTVNQGSLVYLSTELLSPDLAADLGLGGEIGRFMAQWDFSVDELNRMADEQIKDFQLVALATEMGELIPRRIPEQEGIVSDPMTSEFYTYDGDTVTGGGRYWGCAYCGHRTRCSSHPATGRFSEPEETENG